MSPAGVSQCTTAHMSCLVRSRGLVHSCGLPVHNSGCEFRRVHAEFEPRLCEQLTHVHFLARAPKAEVIPLDDCLGDTTLVDAHQTRLATGTTRKPFLTKHRLQLSCGYPGSVRWQHVRWQHVEITLITKSVKRD